MKPNLINEVAPFEIEFKVVHLKANSPWQIDFQVKMDSIIHLGLCLPKSCSINDVWLMTRYAINGGVLEDLNFLEARAKILMVKDLNLDYHFFKRPSFVIFSSMVAVTLFMFCLYTNESTRVITRGFDLEYHLRYLYTIRLANGRRVPVARGLKSLITLLFVVTHVGFFGYFIIRDKGSLLAALEDPDFQTFIQTKVLVEAIFVMNSFLTFNAFLNNHRLLDEIRDSKMIDFPAKLIKIILKRYCR